MHGYKMEKKLRDLYEKVVCFNCLPNTPKLISFTEDFSLWEVIKLWIHVYIYF